MANSPCQHGLHDRTHNDGLPRLRSTTTLAPNGGQPGSFAVDLDAGWSSLVGVHGGYMCALAVRGRKRWRRTGPCEP